MAHSTEEHKWQVCLYMNLVFGSSAASDLYWTSGIKLFLLQKYPEYVDVVFSRPCFLSIPRPPLSLSFFLSFLLSSQSLHSSLAVIPQYGTPLCASLQLSGIEDEEEYDFRFSVIKVVLFNTLRHQVLDHASGPC